MCILITVFNLVCGFEMIWFDSFRTALVENDFFSATNSPSLSLSLSIKPLSLQQDVTTFKTRQQQVRRVNVSLRSDWRTRNPIVNATESFCTRRRDSEITSQVRSCTKRRCSRKLRAVHRWLIFWRRTRSFRESRWISVSDLCTWCSSAKRENFKHTALILRTTRIALSCTL